MLHDTSSPGIGAVSEARQSDFALRQHALDRDFGLHFHSEMGSDALEFHAVPGLGTVSLKTLAVATLFMVGTLFYKWAERLSWIDAMYCTTGIITTVGQVIVPRTAIGRVFTAFFNLASLGLGVLLLMEIADSRRESARRLLRRTSGVNYSTTSLEVAALVIGCATTMVVMAVLLMLIEGWSSFWEALYFCLICGTGEGSSGPVATGRWLRSCHSRIAAG